MPRFITALCILLALAACQDETIQAQGAQPQDRTTPSNLDRFGAAAWIPADYSYFSSTQKLGELIEDLVDSRAMQSLVRLPMVMVALGKVEESLQAMSGARSQSPMLDDALTLGAEALDREIFLACGKEFETLASTLLTVWWQMGLNGGLRGGLGQENNSGLPALVEALVPHLHKVRVPPVLIGMRVEDRQRARALLDQLIPYIESLGILKSSKVANGFQSWTIHDHADGPPTLGSPLLEAGVLVRDARQVIKWVASLQLTISVGMRDDYLLLSIGDNADHLKNLGEQPTLANQPVFRRARERKDAPVLQTYMSPGLRLPLSLDGEAVVKRLRPLFPAAEDHPQFFTDLDTMISELGQPGEQPAPYLTVTYRNEGLDTLTIDGRYGASSSQRPLALLGHATDGPALAYARRAEPMIDSYKRFAHWVRTMLGYYDAIIGNNLTATARNEYETARKTFGPALTELHVIMAEALLPAIDEHESLLVLEDSFRLDLGPGAGAVDGLTLPRLGLMWRVQDGAQLTSALDRMRKVAERLLGQNQSPLDNPTSNNQPTIKLPAPTQRKTDAGTLYSYELGLPPWLNPCVLLDGETIVFALTEEHAQKLMQQVEPVGPGGVAFDQRASSATSIEFSAISELLHTNALHLLRWAAKAEQIPAAQATLIWTHLEPMLKALATLGTYQSRTWHEGNETIHRSWLRVRDGR